MSYVEDAIYNFIKKILTRGVITLTNKRFLTYTIISIILPVMLTAYTFIKGGDEVTTTYNILFNLQLAVCVALILTGLISLKINLVKIEHLIFIIIALIFFGLSFIDEPITKIIENVFVYAGFYSWIVTTNLTALLAIREFIVTWPGWVVRLGDKPDRILFSPIIKLLLFLSIAWFTYTIFTDFSWILLLAFFAGSAIFYTLYVFLPVTKDSTMSSILSIYYLFLLYHLFVRAETSSGAIIIDIILIVAVTLFTAQGVSNLIASKKHALPYQWDSLIIMLLGFMLGYHLLSVRIALLTGLKGLYSLFHDISFGFGTLIIFAILLLYAGKKDFRDFSKTKITTGYAVKQFATLGIEAVNNYARDLKDKIKNKTLTIEIKKRKDNE